MFEKYKAICLSNRDFVIKFKLFFGRALSPQLFRKIRKFRLAQGQVIRSQSFLGSPCFAGLPKKGFPLLPFSQKELKDREI